MNINTSRFTFKLLAVSFAAAAGMIAAPVFAGTATDNLAVSASISANCTIDASSSLAFGAYDPIVSNKSTKLDGTGSISVTCTNGSAVTIELGQGSNPDSGSTDAAPLRQMASGANRLAYFLYSDSGHSTVWAIGSAVDVDETGNGTAQAHTVYGQVTEDQNVPTGSYSDTVVATVTF